MGVNKNFKINQVESLKQGSVGIAASERRSFSVNKVQKKQVDDYSYDELIGDRLLYFCQISCTFYIRPWVEFVNFLSCFHLTQTTNSIIECK